MFYCFRVSACLIEVSLGLSSVNNRDAPSIDVLIYILVGAQSNLLLKTRFELWMRHSKLLSHSIRGDPAIPNGHPETTLYS